MLENKLCAIDFDGFLCEEQWPDIGKPKLEVIEYCKLLKKRGNKLVLWTCRDGELLKQAIDWCKEYGLEFDGINENLKYRIEKYHTDPRKLGYDAIFDDRSYPFGSIFDAIHEEMAERNKKA